MKKRLLPIIELSTKHHEVSKNYDNLIRIIETYYSDYEIAELSENELNILLLNTGIKQCLRKFCKDHNNCTVEQLLDF